MRRLLLLAAILFAPTVVCAAEDELPLSGKIDGPLFAADGQGYLPPLGYKPLQILGDDEMLVYPADSAKHVFLLKGVPTKGVKQDGPWIEFNMTLKGLVFKVGGLKKYKNTAGFTREVAVLSPLTKAELKAFGDRRRAAEEAAEKASIDSQLRAIAERKAAAAKKERDAVERKAAAKEAVIERAAQVERDKPRRAAGKLTSIKQLAKEGKADLAIVRLGQLIKEYPTTPAATEARKLKKKLEAAREKALDDAGK